MRRSMSSRRNRLHPNAGATPNAILTPHVAGVSHESIKALREATIRNLTSVLDGHPLVNEITA